MRFTNQRGDPLTHHFLGEVLEALEEGGIVHGLVGISRSVLGRPASAVRSTRPKPGGVGRPLRPLWVHQHSMEHSKPTANA